MRVFMFTDRPSFLSIAAAGIVLSAVVISGCSSTTPAPVVHRAPSSDVSPEKREFYTVGRGDTLSGIAARFGVTTANLIEWNGLSTRAVTPATPILQAGQVLRVKAAASTVAQTPVTPPKPVESDAVQVSPVKPPPSNAADAPKVALKTGPKGQKRPYSDNVYADMSRGETPAVSTPAVSAGATPPVAISTPSTPPVPVVGAVPTVATTGTDAKPAEKSAEPREVAGLSWAWPAAGKVVQNYNGTSNKSILLSGEPGRPVLAVAKGTVLFAKEYQDYGKLVIVSHGPNLVSVYAQNNAIAVKDGQTVERGQKLADQGPRLQFEIRRDGKPVDPGAYLPQR